MKHEAQKVDTACPEVPPKPTLLYYILLYILFYTLLYYTVLD